MGNRGNGDPIAPHQLPQAFLFALAHFLRHVHHDRSEVWPLWREEGREPRLREGYLSVLSASLTLGTGTKTLWRVLESEGIRQRRDIVRDPFSDQR